MLVHRGKREMTVMRENEDRTKENFTGLEEDGVL